MKFLRLAITAVFAFAFGNAYAFHSGGVAECEGCHTMHNSLDNESVFSNENTKKEYGTHLQSGPYLLKSNSQSGACLNCHLAADSSPSSYHIATDDSKLGPGLAPVEMTPGGDFAWLKKTMTFVVRGNTTTNDGARHGHNVIAADFGYVADDLLTVAPGGTYPAPNLACSSCHDPHGRYRRLPGTTVTYSTTGLPIFNSGSYNSSADPIPSVSAVGAYRLLGGNGYQPKSLTGSYAFTTDPMDVVVASSYNRSEATDQRLSTRGTAGSDNW